MLSAAIWFVSGFVACWVVTDFVFRRIAAGFGFHKGEDRTMRNLKHDSLVALHDRTGRELERRRSIIPTTKGGHE